jgi:hypothetical protein
MESRLIQLKEKIELMDKKHHIGILKIIKNCNTIKINENRNGIYINLSFLPENIIDEIDVYLQYVNDQEQLLATVETKKEEFKTNYYTPVI